MKESQLAIELTEQQQIVRCPACTDLFTILSTIREEEGMSLFNDCSFLSSLEYSQSIEWNNHIIYRNIESYWFESDWEKDHESWIWWNEWKYFLDWFRCFMF